MTSKMYSSVATRRQCFKWQVFKNTRTSPSSKIEHKKYKIGYKKHVKFLCITCYSKIGPLFSITQISETLWNTHKTGQFTTVHVYPLKNAQLEAEPKKPATSIPGHNNQTTRLELNKQTEHGMYVYCHFLVTTTRQAFPNLGCFLFHFWESLGQPRVSKIHPSRR